MRALLSCLCLILVPLAATAQDVQPGVFTSYDSLRSELDELINDRALVDMTDRFGAGEASLQELMAAEAQMQATYVAPLENHAMIREFSEGEGITQQLIAYWGDDNVYLYVYLMFHEREDGVFALQMNFNSDPRPFLPLF